MSRKLTVREKVYGCVKRKYGSEPEHLLRRSPEQFTFMKLKNEYGIFAVRGPRGIPHFLSEALKK